VKGTLKATKNLKRAAGSEGSCGLLGNHWKCVENYGNMKEKEKGELV
jgi:hypothetical protein